MIYYNTTNETGAVLKDSKHRADTQEEKILEYFDKHICDYETPSGIWCKAFDQKVLLTSVRRAMTSLAIAGKLIKTDIRVAGYYGKTEHCWQLSKLEPESEKLF